MASAAADQIDLPEEKKFDYTERSQWLRAAVLGVSDGLVSTSALMMGIGATKDDSKIMILIGLAELFAGAASMAIGEYVSVCSQLDIEVAQMKRGNSFEDNAMKKKPPNPFQSAMVSGLLFSLGATVPILAAAFITNHRVRLGVVVAATSLALVVFGGVGAVLGGSKIAKSCVRMLLGGWMAMAITCGLTKLLVYSGLKM